MREMKDSGVEWIGEIPKEWEVKRVKAVLCERNETNNPIKTNFILSLTNDRGVIPYNQKGDVGNKSKDDLTAYKLAYPNDIVLNSMNVIIGSVALSSYFGCVSPVYYMLYVRNTSDSIRYYNYLFQTKELQNKLKGYGNGIMEIRMRIQMSKLNTVELPIPSSEQQHHIADYLDNKCTKIDNIINKQQTIIEKLKAYKQSVITEAVTKGLNPDVKMKDSGVEWIGEIPERWKISHIKYIVDFEPSCDKSQLNETSIITYTPMDCIKNGWFINNKAILKNVSNSLTPYQEGDIVMAKVTPCFENGNIAIMESLASGYGLGSSELFVFRPKNIITKYLFYWLQNNLFKQLACSTMTGTGGLKRVSSSFVKNCYIHYPPKSEQQQIVDYLDKKCSAIDSAIDKKQAIIEKLTEYKKSLIYEVVTGKKEV